MFKWRSELFFSVPSCFPVNDLLEMAVYTDRVRDVLEYVGKNPMDVKGEQMSYQAWKDLDPSRLPDVVEGLGREDVIVKDRLEAGNPSRINRPKLGKREEHMCDVTLGMLYLACGGLDEAHDLALPHSWSMPTTAGGAAVKDTKVATEASYLHAFVHRKEGQWVGQENNLSGWSNACYWFGVTDYHTVFPLVHQKALEVARTYSEPVKTRIVAELGSEWDPDAFTRLCKAAVGKKDAELSKFCGDVTNAEWRLLFDECNSTVNKT